MNKIPFYYVNKEFISKHKEANKKKSRYLNKNRILMV